MATIETLAQSIQARFNELIQSATVALSELTIEVKRENLHEVCYALRDEEPFKFAMLVDVCGVDYQEYGISEWQTHDSTDRGFSRGVSTDDSQGERFITWDKPRFAVVYHLLSLTHNHRIRLRTFAEGEPPLVNSVITIWPAADWFEREAFDLYGIVFSGHPDLRRILTDYGFIGHPFRKDFPLIGNVEMRYDAASQRCVYEPTSIQARTLVPKVVRDDNRYLEPNAQEGRANG
jgi:NADH-quinone oxidoreductase subunit C